MDLRESCISSFFLHAIAILLAAAISQHNLSAPGGMIVTLSAGTFEKALKDTQPTGGDAQEFVGPEQPATVTEEMVEPVENPVEPEVASEEKPAETPKAEKVPETPQATGTGAPPGQDMIGLAKIHHVAVIHTQAFVESTSRSIQKALHKEIDTDLSGGMKEGTAEVIFYFNDKGGIGEVRGSADSDMIRELLQRIDWTSFPAPGAFRLRMNGLRVQIKIVKGEPSLSFSAL